MAALHLTLHRCWFDSILRGEKIEEYREIKPHWTRLLLGREYSEIHFRNGYARNAPWMRVECLGLRIGEWREKAVYIIRLGRILDSGNLRDEKDQTFNDLLQATDHPSPQPTISDPNADGQSQGLDQT